MRRYETTVIIEPDLSEDDRTTLFNRIKEIISQQQGTLIQEDQWGTKKLAYEIKKRVRGYYALYDYCCLGPTVDEIERFFRIDDRVLKFMTIQLDEDADPENILAQIAAEKEPAAEEKPKAAEEAAEPEAPQAETKESAVETETAKPATETSEKE